MVFQFLLLRRFNMKRIIWWLSARLIRVSFRYQFPENVLHLKSCNKFTGEKENSTELLTMNIRSRLTCPQCDLRWLNKFGLFSNRFYIGITLALHSSAHSIQANKGFFLISLLSSSNCFPTLLSYISDYRWRIMIFHSEKMENGARTNWRKHGGQNCQNTICTTTVYAAV